MSFCICVQAVYFYLYLRAHATSPSHLFALPEHQVHEAADESHREADPGQDVGGAVRAFLKAHLLVKAIFLSCIDGCCNHHTQSWKEERGERKLHLIVDGHLKSEMFNQFR